MQLLVMLKEFFEKGKGMMSLINGFFIFLNRAVKIGVQKIAVWIFSFVFLILISFLLFARFVMPIPSELSRNIAIVVNSQLSKLELEQNLGVSAALGLDSRCSNWSLAGTIVGCASIEVPNELVKSSLFPKVIQASLFPCNFVETLPVGDRDQIEEYFDCNKSKLKFKLMFDVVEISKLHPEPGVTIIKRSPVRSMEMQNY